MPIWAVMLAIFQVSSFDVKVVRAEAFEGSVHVVSLVSCIDINKAPLEALRRIVHIDEVRGRQIIELRQQRAFRNVDDLTRVSGIAAARLREIKEQGLACVPTTFELEGGG
jgi:DNA uptake protein ComE-like DNA-binding protein